jgi:hypothetical protein
VYVCVYMYVLVFMYVYKKTVSINKAYGIREEDRQ